MSSQTAMESKILMEMANFHKTMEELHLLKKVSRDLREYKKMVHVKKFD
jgi:hypothetical protein